MATNEPMRQAQLPIRERLTLRGGKFWFAEAESRPV